MSSNILRYKIADISRLSGEEDVVLLYGQFLDGFKNASNKYELIQDEPSCENISNRWMLVLAATAHKLANDNSLSVPDWVFKNSFCSDAVCYAFDTKNKDFQAYLTETTPFEFKIRGLMFGENVTKRV